MDKVQFNTQMVTMRKTVKRAKVHLIHHLTRQIAVLRKKKGSGKQQIKNERRAGRLVKEIEAVNDLPPDEVTMSAIISKEPLETVLGKATSTTEERAMSRLVHHKLVSHGVASFKDLVTDDLLAIGKKKDKAIQRGTEMRKRRGSESSNDESDDGDGDDDSLEGRSDGEETDGESDEEEASAERLAGPNSGRFSARESTLAAQTRKLREQMESRHKKKKQSGFFIADSGDEDGRSDSGEDDGQGSDEGGTREEDMDDEDDESIEDLDDDLDDMGENFNAEFRELSAQFRKERRGDGSSKEAMASSSATERRKKSKGLDSMFVGKLSGGPRASSATVTTVASRVPKNRPGQAKRQLMNKKRHLEELRRPASRGSGDRHVALVDLPSLQAREQQRPSRVIPGINAPYEKPTKTDASGEKLLPSQRPRVSEAPKRDRKDGKRKEDSARGGGGGGGRGPLRGAAGGQTQALHPSWEAKKRKKEQESKIVPFLGKKITFDD